MSGLAKEYCCCSCKVQCFTVVTTFQVYIYSSLDCVSLSEPLRALKTGEEKRYRHHFLSARSYKDSPDIMHQRQLVQFKVCLFGAEIWTLRETTNHHCLNKRTQNWHVHAQTTTTTEVNRLKLHPTCVNIFVTSRKKKRKEKKSSLHETFPHSQTCLA